MDDGELGRKPPGNGRLVAAAAALVALSLVPDLRESVQSATQPMVSTWDSANVIGWDYMINQGLVPMKDFFYPYGFQWLFALFPEGPVFAWLCQAAVVGLAAWALWRLSGGDGIRVVLCLAVLALWISLNPFAWRYLAGLMIPVTYAALGPARHARLTRGHLIFGAACGLAAFWEADLLLFGAAGAGLVLVGELCSGRLGWEPRSLARGLLVDSVPAVIAIAALALAWLASGNADGNARWFLGLTTNSAYAAPDQINDGALVDFSVAPSLTSLQVALPSLLAAAGLLHAIFGGNRTLRVAPILLAGSGLLLVLLLKDLIRPAGFGFLIASVVLLWSAILLWRPRSLAVGALIGALLGTSYVWLEKDYATGATGYLGDAVSAPASAVRSIRLAFDSGAVERASQERFDVERFPGASDLAAAREYLAATDGRPASTFAVLGDAQLLYPLFRQRPPYHSQLYDASPIYEQRAMVESLDDERPELLVWRRDFFWDRLPYHIRDPIIFNYALSHYLPLRRGWTTDILRRRGPSEAIPANYWRQRLGTTVDLGFIPSLSEADEASHCEGGDGCSDYAIVEGEPDETGETVSVRLSGGAGSFEVRLQTREGVDEYPLRLDRLWFWPLLGSTPTIVSQTSGWSVRLTKLRSGDNLY